MQSKGGGPEATRGGEGDAVAATFDEARTPASARRRRSAAEEREPRGRPPRPRARTLLDPGPDLQRHRVDPETPNRLLPHVLRRRVEHEGGIRRRGEPGGRRQ